MPGGISRVVAVPGLLQAEDDNIVDLGHGEIGVQGLVQDERGGRGADGQGHRQGLCESCDVSEPDVGRIVVGARQMGRLCSGEFPDQGGGLVRDEFFHETPWRPPHQTVGAGNIDVVTTMPEPGRTEWDTAMDLIAFPHQRIPTQKQDLGTFTRLPAGDRGPKIQCRTGACLIGNGVEPRMSQLLGCRHAAQRIDSGAQSRSSMSGMADDVETTTEFEVLTWAELGEVTEHLAKQVVDSGFRPNVVIAIARGGLVIAGSMTYALDVKLVDAINVEFYVDINETRPDPILLAPMLDSASIAEQKILVVDDVADSGRTLALVLKLLRGFGADVRSAVLYHKPRSIVTPDYSWRRTDAWITFPWSATPPLVRRVSNG